MKPISPTPHPDVNEILDLLLNYVKEILQAQFVGMYLYGSLSSGDFNPETSDVDFLVVTTDSLSANTIAELEAMHKRIWASGRKRAARLEGAYISQHDIRRHTPNNAPSPTVNERKFYVDRPGSDWIIQRHVVREYGIVLAGPDPKTLIDFVGADDIRHAVLGILNEWWFPMLDDPAWLQKHESNYHGYTVITMCRALHALKHGTIVSKPVAINWAKEELDIQWHPLIEQAVASQYGRPSEFLNETLELIRFTREHIRKISYAQDSF
jgi:predicted nucleotidyltransferase